jgi:hypothetical protein
VSESAKCESEERTKQSRETRRTKHMAEPPPVPVEPKPRGSDPWSDETWGQNALNVTFETVETDVFEFSAEDSVVANSNEEEFALFRGGVAPPSKRGVPTGPPLVTVTVHERLSAVYNGDVAEEPVTHVEGAIHVCSASTADMSRHPFCLVLRDLLGHMELLEQDRSDVAQDVSTQVSRTSLHRTDRVLRVSLPATQKVVPVARYICSNQLRSVPLVRVSLLCQTNATSVVGCVRVSLLGAQIPITSHILLVVVVVVVVVVADSSSRVGSKCRVKTVASASRYGPIRPTCRP